MCGEGLGCVALLLLLVLLLLRLPLLLNLCKQHSVCLIVIAVFADLPSAHGKEAVHELVFHFGKEKLKKKTAVVCTSKQHEIFMMRVEEVSSFLGLERVLAFGPAIRQATPRTSDVIRMARKVSVSWPRKFQFLSWSIYPVNCVWVGRIAHSVPPNTHTQSWQCHLNAFLMRTGQKSF